ncbi:MAG: type II secretion system F family protein, partial [Clostridiaceae bacterium]|nr:type II secretion system F family protein [Clostridiaceae bacterium]
MLTFKYECINKQGQSVKGQLSAETVTQAVEKLRGMGLSVIDLDEYKPKKK